MACALPDALLLWVDHGSAFRRERCPQRTNTKGRNRNMCVVKAKPMMIAFQYFIVLHPAVTPCCCCGAVAVAGKCNVRCSVDSLLLNFRQCLFDPSSITSIFTRSLGCSGNSAAPQAFRMLVPPSVWTLHGFLHNDMRLFDNFFMCWIRIFLIRPYHNALFSRFQFPLVLFFQFPTFFPLPCALLSSSRSPVSLLSSCTSLRPLLKSLLFIQSSLFFYSLHFTILLFSFALFSLIMIFSRALPSSCRWPCFLLTPFLLPLLGLPRK